MRKKILALLLISATPVVAAPKSVSITGKLPDGYTTASFYSQKGYLTQGKMRGNNFSITVPTQEIKGGSVILNRTGNRFGGAVVLAQKGTKSFLNFATTSAKTLPLGTVTATSAGYLKLKKALSSKSYDGKSSAVTSLLGAPLGLNVASSNSRFQRVRSQGNTVDEDRDGVPDGVDVDADGDGSVDVLTSGASADTQAPYLVVRENMAHTINATATGVPGLSDIDAILTAGDGVEFSIGFAFSVQEDLSRITGAHVVCDDADTLCGRTAGLATINGSNGLWRDYHPDGTTYPGLAPASSGPSERSFNTGLSPHVGPSAIVPGTTYRVEFTATDGSVVRSKLVTVTPYLVTVPALHTYNANSTGHSVDYTAISSEAGASPGNPIILGGDGLFTATFWRPQRQGLGGADGDGFVDVGRLRYGLVLMGPASGGGTGEKSCAGFYSSLSPTLSERGGAPIPNDFWPLSDSAVDAPPSSANTLSFTVDLKSCAANAGYSTGDYIVSLQAAGADLGHGSNRSGQDLFVRIQ